MFAVIYALVFALTARTYGRIVEEDAGKTLDLKRHPLTAFFPGLH